MTMWLSWFVLFANPVSACMLAWLVLHHRAAYRLGWWVRALASMLCIGLLIQAAGSLIVLTSYSPPRTLAWVPQIFALNGLIYAAFFRTIQTRRTP